MIATNDNPKNKLLLRHGVEWSDVCHESNLQTWMGLNEYSIEVIETREEPFVETTVESETEFGATWMLQR